jgi:hypothetical protein
MGIFLIGMIIKFPLKFGIFLYAVQKLLAVYRKLGTSAASALGKKMWPVKFFKWQN